MRRAVLTCVLLFLVAGVSGGQERLKFDQPALADPGAVDFALSRVTYDVERQRIDVWLREVDPETGALKFDPTHRVPDGKQIHVEYVGAEAMALLQTVNTMDFSPPAPTQKTRIMQKLVADGKIAAAAVQ